jgi:DNA-binding CsgD family transcriptional regulator
MHADGAIEAQADLAAGQEGAPAPGLTRVNGIGGKGRRYDDGGGARLARARLAGAGLVAFDDDLRIVAWDTMAERLTGTPSREVIGRHFSEVFGASEPRPAHRRPDGPGLTPRQRQVLELVAEGIPAKVIAARLGLAPPTVRNHIRALLQHLDAHSQLEAVATARRRGLL